jgi:cell pole-organizing protein PopZ
VVFTDPAGSLRRPAVEARPLEEDNAGPALLSDQATAAVTSAFGSLAHTVLVQNGRTLEDIVRDMLHPMLKTWLDDNLPTIVERLVRAEIERVSRGR